MRSAHNGTATHVCPHCRTQRGSVMPHVAANWDRFGCGQKCQPTEQGIREVAARAKALPQHGTPQQATAEATAAGHCGNDLHKKSNSEWNDLRKKCAAQQAVIERLQQDCSGLKVREPLQLGKKFGTLLTSATT